MIIALLASVAISVAGEPPFRCDTLDAACAREQMCHSSYGKSCTEASAEVTALYASAHEKDQKFRAAHRCISTPWSRRVARLMAQKHALMPIVVWSRPDGQDMSLEGDKECPQRSLDGSLVSVSPTPPHPITAVRSDDQ